MFLGRFIEPFPPGFSPLGVFSRDIGSVGVDVYVAESFIVVFVSVLLRSRNAYDADPGFAVLGVKNHRAYEVGIKSDLKMVGEGVVRMVQQMIVYEDVPRLIGQVLPAFDYVGSALEDSRELLGRHGSYFAWRKRLGRGGHGLIDVF